MSEPDSEPPRSEAPADDRLPPLARVIFYLPAYLISQLVTAAIVLTAWLTLTGRTASDLTQLEVRLPLALGMSAAFFPVLLVGTWLFARGLDRRRLPDLGWRWPPGPRARVALETLGALGAAAAVLAGWFLLGRIGFEVRWGGWAALGEGNVPSASGLGLLFAGLLLAAAGEELAFRGYVFHVLKERGSWASAAGLQAAFFAALHASNPDMSAAGLLNTFLLGLVLAAVVEITRSLYAATVAHAMWNFLLALGLPLSGIESLGVAKLELVGPAGWTGGAYGPEGSWLLTGLLVPLVFGLALAADRARALRGEDGAPVPAP